MIRSLTIIENKDNTGNVAYQLSGDLPIDEAAKALVIIAFNANKTEEKKEEKKSDVVQGDRN
jgi:hypothetical protein